MKTLNPGCKPLVLITGATGGIGKALAMLLKSRGYDLILTARNQEKLNALGIQLDCATIAADLSTKAGIDRICTAITEYPITHLINNAGLGFIGHMSDQPLDETDALLHVLITAPTHFSHCFLQKSDSRCLVNISSVAGFGPDPFMAVYGSAKAYLNRFTQSIRYEYPQKSILLVCPGPVDTAFDKRAGATRKRSGMSAEKCAYKIWQAIQKDKFLNFTSIQSALCFTAMKTVPPSLLSHIQCKIQKNKIK